MRTYATPLASSSSIIQGFPETAHKFLNYQAKMRAALQAAMEQAAVEYEQRIQARARPTWGDLADAIRVRVTPDLGFSIEVEAGYQDLANLVEFGTPGASPSGVLRMSAVTADTDMSQRLQQLLQQEMR